MSSDSSAKPPYLAILFTGSLVVTIAAVTNCHQTDDCHGDFGWAVACGVISTIITLVLLVLERVAGGLAERLIPLSSLFLLVWWAAGAGVTTFRGPFKVTGNGYFAAWACFLAALSLAGSRTSTVSTVISGISGVGENQSLNEKALIQVFFSSVVMLIAAGSLCAHDSTYFPVEEKCSDERAWAVAASVIGGVFSLAFFIAHRLGAASENLQKIFSVLLLLVFIPGTGVSTFHLHVFPVSGNGFFAAWFAFLATLKYAGGSFPVIQLAMDHARMSISGPPPNTNLPPSEFPDHNNISIHTQPPPADYPSEYPPAPSGYQPSESDI